MTFAVMIAANATVAARTRLITSSIHETYRPAAGFLYYAYRLNIVSAILCSVSPVVTDVLDPVLDDVLDVELLERAFHGTSDTDEKSTSKINKALLTITRNAASDFQDRQVYLYVDGDLWGKVKVRPADVPGDPARTAPLGPGVQYAVLTYHRDRRKARRAREAALQKRSRARRLDDDGALADCSAEGDA